MVPVIAFSLGWSQSLEVYLAMHIRTCTKGASVGARCWYSQGNTLVAPTGRTTGSSVGLPSGLARVIRAV